MVRRIRELTEELWAAERWLKRRAILFRERAVSPYTDPLTEKNCNPRQSALTTSPRTSLLKKSSSFSNTQPRIQPLAHH